MSTHNGIIETATGDLLRAGFVNFAVGIGETLRTDVPIPAKIKNNIDFDKFHRWNGSSWIEIDNNPLDSNKSALSFSLSKQNLSSVDAYLELISDQYTVIFQFNFPGTNTLGNIRDIFCLCKVETSTSPGSIRIYDIDNNNVIAENDNITNEEFSVINLGDVSNLPETSSVFEIQAKASGSEYIRMSNLTLEF